LDSGAILLYARKNSGAAEISTKAVSVGITGTTVIFESRVDSYDRLIVLEGHARFSLNNFPDQSTDVRAGQLLNVKAGSKKLPKPGRVDLRRIMNTHPNRPPPPPRPATGGAVSQGGTSSGYVPNQPVVTGGTQTGPVYPNPTPTPKVHRPSPTPRPTVKPTPRPTPHRRGSKPVPTPRKSYPPIKRAKPTPTPGQIIR
jgi:hypothetical protein